MQQQRVWLAGAIASLFLEAVPTWAAPIYQVHVSKSPGLETLTKVRTQATDAYMVLNRSQQSVILAGTFSNRANAERQVAALGRLGIEAEVVVRDEKDPPLQPAIDASSTTNQPSPVAKPVREQAAAPTPALAEDREYLVVMADITQAERIRRFFPATTEIRRQGQPMLLTGGFSQKIHAQEQADWLKARGFEAEVVVNEAVASAAQGQTVWVLIADPNGEKLAEVQKVVSDAQPLLYDQSRVIKTGGFSSQVAAQPQVDLLLGKGYEVKIVPADRKRSGLVSDNSQPQTQTAAAAADPGYRVIVPKAEAERLARIQAIAPDAFTRRMQEQMVIQVGTYRQRSNAEQALQALGKLGFSGKIVPH